MQGDNPPPSLRDRLAEPRGEELLSSSDPRERERGLERLGHHGSDTAVAALVEALEAGSQVRTSSRSRLAAVRALAPYTAKKGVVERLAEVLRDAAQDTDGLAHLARRTAALALARADSDEALTALLTVVVTDDRGHEVAGDALRQRPPPSWRTLDGDSMDSAGEIARLLGEVGDPRVLGLLRRLAQPSADEAKTRTTATSESPSLSQITIPKARAAAVVALAKLGDGHALRFSKPWLADDAPRVLRLAAVRARVELDAPGAPKLVSALLEDDETRAHGLALAELSLAPELLAALGKLLTPTTPSRDRATQLVARIGGPRATALLVPLLADPNTATRAAFALSRVPHASAAQAITDALAAAQHGAPQRLAMRAALARQMRFGGLVAQAGRQHTTSEPPAAGLLSAAQVSLASKDAADRALGASVLSWLDDERALQLLKHDEPAVALAAAGALLQRGVRDGALLAALKRVETADEDDGRLIGLSAAMLLGDPQVSSATLARWAQATNAMSPSAGYRLARRDSRAFRRPLRALLNGSDAGMRLHVAAGLQHSPQADATSLLAQRYPIESDVRVRRVLLRALSWRTHAPRMAALRLAATLDPDPGCRTIARRALSGRPALKAVTRGVQTVWLSFHDNGLASASSAALRPLLLIDADGGAMPVVSSPDGVVLAGGFVASGRMSLQLAPGAHKRDP